MALLLSWFGGSKSSAIKTMVLWYRVASWSVKHDVFVQFHFFSLFFLLIFLQKHCNLQLIYTLGVYFCSVVLVVTKHTFFIECQGPLFSWCRPRGAQNASVVQISLFSKRFFYFWLLFSSWLSGWPNVADSYQITAFGSRQGEFIGSVGGVSGRCFY